MDWVFDWFDESTGDHIRVRVKGCTQGEAAKNARVAIVNLAKKIVEEPLTVVV